jgi:nucleotide-binding universal stress UspA family protein/quercetin dioxygenase-like cupin family protein
MSDIRTILHPTDFSENARPAFQTACALARDYGAPLLILHVMIPSASPLLSVPPPDPRRAVERQGTLAELPWPHPSDPRIRVEHRLAEGDPAEEILRLAQAVPGGLVVMGTHGRTGLRRFLTGSVAEEVLRQAVCPVLVIKAPLGAPIEAESEAAAEPGAPVDVRPLGTAMASAQTRTLVRTNAVEVVRLIVRAGQEIARPESRGEVIVQCLEGRVALTALGTHQTLEAGTLLHLPASEPLAFKGIEDASVLLTMIVPGR